MQILFISAIRNGRFDYCGVSGITPLSEVSGEAYCVREGEKSAHTHKWRLSGSGGDGGGGGGAVRRQFLVI